MDEYDIVDTPEDIERKEKREKHEERRERLGMTQDEYDAFWWQKLQSAMRGEITLEDLDRI